MAAFDGTEEKKSKFWMEVSIFAFLFVAVPAAPLTLIAQNDYPLPPGDPSTWGVPGHSEELVPEKPAPTPPNTMPAPPLPGNEALSKPSVPSGETEEKYTGTREFRGIGGSGIGQFGPEESQ